jgi:arabinose-5-phosphate isomerase
MTNKEIAVQCLRDEAQAILSLIPQIDGEFDRAIDIILRCKGKVILTGVGKSGHIGAKIAATLSSTGTPAFYVSPLDLYHGDLGVMTTDDVVVAISHSGMTDELLRFIPFLIEENIPIIAITSNPESLLARNSTCHINVGIT